MFPRAKNIVYHTAPTAYCILPNNLCFGKINDEESPQECLKRELAEELGIEVSIGAPLTVSTYHYPAFSVTLYPFICKIASGEIVLHEHAAMAWVLPEELHKLDWAEADLTVIEEYREEVVRNNGWF